MVCLRRFRTLLRNNPPAPAFNTKPDIKPEKQTMAPSDNYRVRAELLGHEGAVSLLSLSPLYALSLPANAHSLTRLSLSLSA